MTSQKYQPLVDDHNRWVEEREKGAAAEKDRQNEPREPPISEQAKRVLWQQAAEREKANAQARDERRLEYLKVHDRPEFDREMRDRRLRAERQNAEREIKLEAASRSQSHGDRWKQASSAQGRAAADEARARESHERERDRNR